MAEAKSTEVVRLLVPPGKDPPPPLGGHLISEEASQPATKVLHELLVPIVSTLIHCCCMMLTNPYPVQVSCMSILPCHRFFCLFPYLDIAEHLEYVILRKSVSPLSICLLSKRLRFLFALC